jgi:RNA-directed DNA polymerase
VYQKLKAWAKRRHPKKSGNWVTDKYWQSIGSDNWVFATRQEGKNPLRLLKHSATEIKRHVKVKSESSPYDGNLVYWSTRKGNNPEMPIRVANLLKRQKGKLWKLTIEFRNRKVERILTTIGNSYTDTATIQKPPTMAVLAKNPVAIAPSLSPPENLKKLRING